MKLRAAILAVLLGLLLLQPAFGNFNNGTAYSSCTKSTAPPSCSAYNECDMPGDTEEEEDCRENPCNPLLGCPSGNFYLDNSSLVTITAYIILKQETILVNDNRVLTRLTECWHPPEF
ncbi:MAG TPA: hypothetical protein VFX58_04000 [Chitinophagaceae bacterium]|nr:hypothetical protein [Chitinophagaceae bacterium]